MSNRFKIIYSVFLCIVFAVQAVGETGEIRLQQGALRKDGSVVDASYATKAATLRGGTEVNNVPQNSSTAMYIGDHSSGAPMRGLFSFDLSYIKTLAGGNPYTINSVTFILTTASRNTNFVGVTTMRAHLTDAFAGEAIATFNSPGTGHAVGGNIGTQISTATLSAAIAGTVGQTLSFTGAGWITAVSNALSGADNTLNFLVKRGTEDGGANYFFRPGDDEHATVNYRPELVINLTYDPRKLSLVIIH